jgi:hypothetical protein
VLALARPLFRMTATPAAAPEPEPIVSAAALQPAPAGPEASLPDQLPPPPASGAPEPVPGPSLPAVQGVPAVPVPAGAAADEVSPTAAVPTAPIAAPEPVRNLAPRIVSHRPRGRGAITVTEGTAVTFSAQAADQNPDDRLVYAWFVDGREAARGQSWRFVAPPAAIESAHTVEIRVSDGGGLNAAPVSWRVEVTPRMSEANVRDWIGRLASAWERSDVATLRLYGVVTSEADAEAIRKRRRRTDSRVTITNESIKIEGRYATVAFDRAEFEKGKLHSSRRESYELEKRPDGFIALRARPK